jgi:hypothetical protein
MKVAASAVVVLSLLGCGKKPEEKPNDPPKLSAAGDVVVPDGHETTFSYAGTPVKLEWTYVSISYVMGRPALRFFAQDRERPGSFYMDAYIPEHTPTFASMAGSTVGAIPWSVSFGNTPEMAAGDGATIKITEVTPTYVAGTFEAQSCDFGTRPNCKNPKRVTNGTFKAFRSALSDDKAFTRYTTQPAPPSY